MRNWSSLIVLASATALSGCAGTALDQISALNTDCAVSQTAVNCGPTTPPTTPTPTTTTPPPPVTNTSGLTTGDTTIALEANKLVNGKSAISKITYGTDTAMIEFNTNTKGNGQWPTAKTMDLYAPATGTAFGADYNEYRAFEKDKYNEVLQVWSFNKNPTTKKYNSYATQYRDVSGSGTSPTHQAWSFGGQYTTAAAMPTSGPFNYSGEWGATGQSSNMADSNDRSQTVSWNNDWRIKGTSVLTGDFGSKSFSGVLTPTNYWGKNKDGGWTDAMAYNPDPNPSVPGATPWNPYANRQFFMYSNIILKGTISTSATDAAKPNQIIGTAKIDPAVGWINSSNNSMAAGFFGDNGASANEVTGVFSADAAIVAPTGIKPNGDNVINDDRGAFLSMSGFFHGQ